MSRRDDLHRIEQALEEALVVARRFQPGSETVTLKEGGDPVTEADHAIDEVLRRILPQDGEGWLSEETVDDHCRLQCSRVWVVDPIDGTREFVEGIPEWCISIGLVEDGLAVAGGICNPQTGEQIVGCRETGVRLNGELVRVSEEAVAGGTVLASRSEIKRGEWERFLDDGFRVVPMGSVAYKMARVAAGLAEATWTLVPKNEWDVAAGVALIEASGGEVCTLEGDTPRFNRPNTLFNGMLAWPGKGGDQDWTTLARSLTVPTN